MGQIRFSVQNRARLGQNALKRAYICGLDEIPWRCRTTWDGNQFVIERDRDDVREILRGLWYMTIQFRIWETMSALGQSPDDRKYDTGMIEEVMPVFRYKGKAYETRHAFEGNLQTGECTLHKHGGEIGRMGLRYNR